MSDISLTKMSERRKFFRFHMEVQGYATLRDGFTKIGKIKDISFNGLSFNYLAKDVQEEEFSHVDIFMVGKGFHLAKVPCKIIYDIQEPISGVSEISSHRCGMKFGTLEAEQQNKLALFLRDHTKTEIEVRSKETGDRSRKIRR